MSGNNKRILEHLDDQEFEKLLSECGCLGVGASSEDGEILKQNLAKIYEYSGVLFGMCSGLTEVEDWIKDKISKASQSISEVKHYLEYKSSAYAVQQTDIAPYQPSSGQRLASHEKMPGDKLAVMTQVPAMTPQSAPVTADQQPEYGEEYMDYDDEDEVMDDAYSLQSTFNIQDEDY